MTRKEQYWVCGFINFMRIGVVWCNWVVCQIRGSDGFLASVEIWFSVQLLTHHLAALCLLPGDDWPRGRCVPLVG